MPEKHGNKRKKSLNFYLMTTQIVNKFLKLKNKDKLKDNKNSEAVDLLDEHKNIIENECSVKLKERSECLLTVVLGYFIGVLQKNISCSSSENNNNNYNLIIGEPDISLVEAIHKSKNYKRMIEEQTNTKNEVNQIFNQNKSSSIVKVQIEGDCLIPEFMEKTEISNKKNDIIFPSNSNNLQKEESKEINEKPQNNIDNKMLIEEEKEIQNNIDENNKKKIENKRN